jgi:hypothetical protein
MLDSESFHQVNLKSLTTDQEIVTFQLSTGTQNITSPRTNFGPRNLQSPRAKRPQFSLLQVAPGHFNLATPRFIWLFCPFPALFTLLKHSLASGMLNLPTFGVFPRSVTNRHVTRARPTSPGTPWPFKLNHTRPSCSLSENQSPIGSGHCPLPGLPALDFWPSCSHQAGVYPNRPAAFRPRMPKGFDSPGQQNLPQANMSGMPVRKKTQISD